MTEPPKCTITDLSASILLPYFILISKQQPYGPFKTYQIMLLFCSSWLLIKTVLNMAYIKLSFLPHHPFLLVPNMPSMSLGSLYFLIPLYGISFSISTDRHHMVLFLTSFGSFLESQISFQTTFYSTQKSSAQSLFNVLACFIFLHIIYPLVHIFFIYLFIACFPPKMT